MKKTIQAFMLTVALCVAAGCGGGEKKEDKPADKGAAPAAAAKCDKCNAEPCACKK